MTDQTRDSGDAGLLTMVASQRVCPQCLSASDDAVCASDGFATVPASQLSGNRPDPLIGQVFQGRYRVEALLGAGGMGTVYRAIHLQMDRPVALKVLRVDARNDLERARRFQQEARATSLLVHPHTLRVFDFGQADDGRLFIVAEYLEGRPLADAIQAEAPFEPQRAISIATQILKSLSEAHLKGLVHRDLKPDNVFLTSIPGENEFVKVLDFGLAKQLDAPLDATTLTQDGTALGTPSYMAPEQARGTAVDGRTDLYALGVILHEMLAGQRPFEAENAMALLLKHVSVSPPRLSLASDPDGRLSDLTLRCLAKSPDDRPDTADALAADLERVASTLGTPSAPRPTPASVPSRHAADALTREAVAAASLTTPSRFGPLGFVLVAVAALAVAALAVAAAVWWSGDPVQPPDGEPTPTVAEASAGPTTPQTPAPAPKPTPAPEAKAEPVLPEPAAPAQPVAASPTPLPPRRSAETLTASRARRASEVGLVWDLVSSPPGATVYESGAPLGVTPLVLRQTRERSVELRAPGRRSARVVLRPGVAAKRVTLRKPKRASAPAAIKVEYK